MKSPKNTELEIDEKIKDSATRCEKNLACLAEDHHELCPVDHFFHDKILFIKCLSKGYCSYRTSFGYASYICSCPVRKEIYRKYSR